MARGLKSLLCFCVFLSLFPSKGLGRSVTLSLDRAQTLVTQKKFSLAIRKVKPLLDGLRLTTVETIVLAHKILGISYCETDQKEKSQEHFEILLTFSPSETLEEFGVSPPCKNQYAELQKKEQTLSNQNSKEAFSFAPVKTPTQSQEPSISFQPTPTTKTPSSELSSTLPPSLSTSVSPSQSLPTEISVTPTPSPPPISLTPKPNLTSDLSWLHFLPFGIGQFANREPKKGGTLLLTQTLAVGVAITSFLLFQSEENQGSFAHPTQASVYRGMYWSSLAVGGTIALLGIGDALTTQKRNHHPLPHLLSFQTCPTVTDFSKGSDP